MIFYTSSASIYIVLLDMMDTKRDEIHIGNVGSDVIGSAISGRGNIIGKEVAYSVSGNVVNLHIESISTQTLQELTNIISQPLQADNSDVELDKARANEAKVNKEETNQVLKDIESNSQRERYSYRAYKSRRVSSFTDGINIERCHLRR